MPNPLKYLGSVATVLFLCGSSAIAQKSAPILGTRGRQHLEQALAVLNMREQDLGFEKDVAEPQFALERLRAMLGRPLDLPVMADEVMASVEAGNPAAILDLAADLLESPRRPAPSHEATGAGVEWPADLDPELTRALRAFVRCAEHARHLLDKGFEDVPGPDRRHAAASRLAGLFNAEDRPEVRTALYDAGLSTGLVVRVIREGRAIDPEPAAGRYLDIVTRTDLATVLAAAHVVLEAAGRLEAAVADVRSWPDQPLRVITPCGDIYIGSVGADRFTGKALLILDPGGADVYSGQAGVANGLEDAAVAVVLDLAGDDQYVGTGVAGPGTALFGVTALIDRDGSDVHRAAYTGQAAALFGVSWMEDKQGDDVFQAYGHSQAAGTCGLGVLRDRAGNDLYDVGVCGQGFAGVRGIGLLIDDAGNDRYTAGGREPDHERHPDRYLSLSQGFAIGIRPFAGGGIAALVDRSGNDTYEADVYGQGVSYWYSAGMLLDMAGNDTYSVYHYGQGSGIHLSLGLLADGGGNDFYTGYILAQGNAHDYAVGMLFDRAGDDTYTADHHAQGRAIHNSTALLVDHGGKDAYFARRNTECQGIGSNAERRDYGSLSLLLDLAGKDRYTCGARDDACLIRPDHGVVYDTNAADAPPRGADRVPPGAATNEGPRQQAAAKGSGAPSAPTANLQDWGSTNFTPKSASMEELLFHAQRYGTTEAKRERKRAAREELFSRGPEALRYLMAHVHIKNLWIWIMADQLVRRLEADEAVPILLSHLGSERQDTRRFAAFFLGFHDRPEHWQKLTPLLSDEKAAGVTIRTLGKWGVRECVPLILPFLADEKERRRIVTVNALRDIGDTQTVPHLLEALDDPFFTVRKVAARALVAIGAQAEKDLLRALPASRGPARREIIAALGEIRSRKAVRPLRRLLEHADRGVRAEAALALSSIDPKRAAKWLADTPAYKAVDPTGPFVFPPTLEERDTK